jgi:hypothetical protein
MAGVRIWAVGSIGEAFNATTNVMGYYGSNLLPGNYTVMARLDGYSVTSPSSRITAGAISSLRGSQAMLLGFAVSSGTGGGSSLEVDS